MIKPFSTLFTASLLALSVNGAIAAVHPAPAERHVQAFLTELNRAGGKPIEQRPVPAARKVLSDAQAGDKPLPVFMFFHGGGWILGDFPTHERLVQDLVNASGVAAVFVNYS